MRTGAAAGGAGDGDDVTGADGGAFGDEDL